jgi:hypothetical protein
MSLELPHSAYQQHTGTLGLQAQGLAPGTLGSLRLYLFEARQRRPNMSGLTARARFPTCS